MSIFLPFKAYRPEPARAKTVASRPYDVVNRNEARQECTGNPDSFYHVIKPEIDFPNEVDEHAPEVYQKGKDNLDEMIRTGLIRQDAEKQFYVYQLTMNGHTQTGLVGCCSIDDYFNNVIKKHEKTRPDKEEDRKNHIRAGKMNYEPVFFSYPKTAALDSIVEQACQADPEISFVSDDDVQHTVWSIAAPDQVENITRIFDTQVSSIYIADGHHRTAAGALVGDELRKDYAGSEAPIGYSHFMAVLFPDDQLQILDYNRVVKDLNGYTVEQFLERLSESFTIEVHPSAFKPDQMRTFGMYIDGKWYKLSAREGSFDPDDPIGDLDVTILSQNVLDPLLNIKDLRTDKRIEFVGGIRGMAELEKKVNSGQHKVAFSLYPISMQQLITVSDKNLLMPPKVTWFEPKLRSGLFVYSLENSMEAKEVAGSIY
jgi:uncharacterized protein (DUF1015 family)